MPSVGKDEDNGNSSTLFMLQIGTNTLEKALSYCIKMEDRHEKQFYSLVCMLRENH